jgi:hypothetical protein
MLRFLARSVVAGAALFGAAVAAVGRPTASLCLAFLGVGVLSVLVKDLSRRGRVWATNRRRP